jgi:ParB family chromosome partitioning protein
MGKSALDAKRLNAFLMDPDELTVVGLDTDDGPEHPLYDERVHLPLDQGLVDNITSLGVLETVLVRKNGDRVEVVDGRRRVLHAREANKQNKFKGDDRISVPLTIRRETEQSGFLGVIISANRHRHDDNPLLSAKKAGRLINMGKTEDDAARYFGVSRVAIGQWLKLLDLAPKVQRAIEQGKIAASAAATLVDMTHAEQEAKLEELIAAGATSVQEAKRQQQARRGGKKNGESRGKRPSVKLLRQIGETEAFVGDLSSDARALLMWILGGGETQAKRVKGLWKLLNPDDAE